MPWTLLALAPRAETRVSRSLASLNLTHHIFRVRERVVSRGRVVDRTPPAFPGYVFLEDADGREVVREVPGVIDYVRVGAEIVSLADRIVDAIADACEPGQVIPLPDELRSDRTSRFQPGDRVKITTEKFDAYGVFVESIADERALILVPWLGRDVPVSVPEAELVVMDIDGEANINLAPKKKRKRRLGRRRHRRAQRQGASSALVLG